MVALSSDDRTPGDSVRGFADPAFADLAETFRLLARTPGETGMALAVVRNGRCVVDLWAGPARPDIGRPWSPDTVAPVFSTGKGLVALAAALAVSRGRFDWDDRVADHWPAFARHGKASITVRHILDHASGLILFGRPVRTGDLADPGTMSRILEAMQPRWAPGRRWGYHLATFGPLVAEIVTRTDPARRPFGRWFEDEIAGPRGVSVWFGLPSSFDDRRRAAVTLPRARDIVAALPHAPWGLQRKVLNPVSWLHRTLREVPDADMNDRAWLGLEFPSGNGVADARSVATLYALAATQPDILGLAPAVLADLTADPTLPANPIDRVMGVPSRWHLGFARPSPAFPFSPSPRAFGMPGLGGSFGFADPDAGFGYAFIPTRLGALPFDDPREAALRKRLYACLRRDRSGQAAEALT